MPFVPITITDPGVAAEWHPCKNGELMPSQISRGMSKRVWWLGKCGHEWDAVVSHRLIGTGNGCPYCSGARLCFENSLAGRFPEIAAEWHPTMNGADRPENFSRCSKHQAFFSCPIGHAYKAAISNRTNNLTGCTYCAGKLVCKENCLETKCPEIALQWHPTKNGALTPRNVMFGSHQSVEWICPVGHEYSAPIKRRTAGHGCPRCKESKGEKSVLIWLSENQIPYIRQKIWSECKDRRPLKFDFFLPEQNLCIEYDGEQHYREWRKPKPGDEKLLARQRKDQIKNQFCLENKIELVRIPYFQAAYIDRILRFYVLRAQ